MPDKELDPIDQELVDFYTQSKADSMLAIIQGQDIIDGLYEEGEDVENIEWAVKLQDTLENERKNILRCDEGIERCIRNKRG